jgi:hypothetical protein
MTVRFKPPLLAGPWPATVTALQRRLAELDRQERRVDPLTLRDIRARQSELVLAIEQIKSSTMLREQAEASPMLGELEPEP